MTVTMATDTPVLAVVSQIFPQAGYGFALTEDGREIYFHHHAVGGRTFDKLQTGDTVQVELQQHELDKHAHATRLVRLSRSPA